MKAIVITKPGGPEVLCLQEVPEPLPGTYEARVCVKATAVNRADILQRMGRYPAPPEVPPDIPGLEFAGQIDSVGDKVLNFQKGDKVFGLAAGGTYAQYVVVHAHTLVRMPPELSFVEAAAIPEAFITAYDALITQAGLAAGDTVLISAAGSGVGTAAVQIAKTIGATSIGTARSQSKLTAALELGMDKGILLSDAILSDAILTDADFASQVMNISKEGVDVVLELVGGNYIAYDLHCLKHGGRLLLVGLVAGQRAEIDLGILLQKRLTIKGTTLRMRPLEEKIAASQLLARNLMPLFKKGLLKPVISNVMPLSQAAAAQQYMSSNQNFGKIVLTISED